MSQQADEGEAGEVVTDLVSAGALHRAVALLLHHLVAFDAHPLQIAHVHALHHAAEPEDRHRPTDRLRLRPAANDARLLSTQDLHHHGGGETGLGLPAMTAEGYPERPRHL